VAFVKRVDFGFLEVSCSSLLGLLFWISSSLVWSIGWTECYFSLERSSAFNLLNLLYPIVPLTRFSAEPFCRWRVCRGSVGRHTRSRAGSHEAEVRPRNAKTYLDLSESGFWARNHLPCRDAVRPPNWACADQWDCINISKRICSSAGVYSSHIKFSWYSMSRHPFELSDFVSGIANIFYSNWSSKVYKFKKIYVLYKNFINNRLFFILIITAYQF